MLLKPPSNEDYQEQPTPKTVEVTGKARHKKVTTLQAEQNLSKANLIIPASINAFDGLIKGKEDNDRVTKVNEETGINEILQIVGIIPASNPVKDAEISNARKVFNDAGATLAAAAKQITHVMKFGDKTSEQLNAAKVVAQIHGALEELDGHRSPVINFNIMPMAGGAGNKSILNLVVPRI